MWVEFRSWLPFLAIVVSIAGSWAVARRQVGQNEKAIDELQKDNAATKTAIALLQQEQRQHAGQIRELVRELRDAVSNLQRIALDLAKISGSKTEGH